MRFSLFGERVRFFWCGEGAFLSLFGCVSPSLFGVKGEGRRGVRFSPFFFLGGGGGMRYCLFFLFFFRWEE